MNEFMFYVKLLPLSVSDIFKNNNTFFNRKLRVEALRESIESKLHEEIKKLKQKKTDSGTLLTTKESERLLRLEVFPNFSEVQLENELENYHDVSLNENYYSLLWKKMLGKLKETKQVKVLDALNNLKTSVESEQFSVIAYNKTFNDFFVDVEQELDGVSIQNIKKLYETTSNKKEVRRLANKYNIVIPTNTTKSFIQTKLLQILKDNKKLNDELLNSINNGTIKSLKLILKDLDMTPQDLLSVSEIMDIIIEHIKNKKVETIIPVVHKAPKDETTVVSTPVLQEILTNQKLILRNLEILNEGKNDAKKKKKIDTVFNFVVITLIVIVVVIWMIYAITTLFA